jgi:sugar phosphate isomerase/epimerase
MESAQIDAVLDRVVGRLIEPPYKATYPNETELEVEVWRRMVLLAEELGFDCLTSHAVHADRSVAKWQEFAGEPIGPDVRVLGANNRLDIVLRNRDVGSIGIEVKCLGESGHTGKLTQGLGQAVLALAKRDRTVLLLHCGTVTEADRVELRDVASRICDGFRVRVIVVP